MPYNLAGLLFSFATHHRMCCHNGPQRGSIWPVDRRTLEAEWVRKSNEKAECYAALRLLREIRAGYDSASSSLHLAEICSRYQVPVQGPRSAEQQSELVRTLIDTIVKRCLRLDSELKIISDRLRNTPA
jgi:hypothetical protein